MWGLWIWRSGSTDSHGLQEVIDTQSGIVQVLYLALWMKTLYSVVEYLYQINKAGRNIEETLLQDLLENLMFSNVDW